MIPWTDVSSSKRHLDRFTNFCTAHPRAQHTDTQTTLRATSVAIGRILCPAMRPKHTSILPVISRNADWCSKSFHRQTDAYRDKFQYSSKKSLHNMWHLRVICVPNSEIKLQIVEHCALRRVATSLCRGHIDEMVIRLPVLPHHERGTGCRQTWSCCDRQTHFGVYWKHSYLSLFMGTKEQLDLLCDAPSVY